MKKNEKKRIQDVSDFRERRKKTDWVTYMATILSLISWITAFCVLVVLDKAQPESEHMFTRYFGISVRNYWETSLLPLAFALLLASLCTCVIAFIFNMLRKRRKTDKYKKSIIVIGIITIIGIILFINRFSEFLI